MGIPETSIENILYGHSIDWQRLHELGILVDNDGASEFENIHWLNTPGPIYTSWTDNCGTGQIEALHNVGSDADYHEVIFKQPCTLQELKEVSIAAAVDPFDSYYFDGTKYWNKENVLAWWHKSEARISQIIEMYWDELHLPAKPHVITTKIGNKTFTGQLYGPPRPIPENYKYWLDFYQFEMKIYLEWFLSKIHNQTIILPALDYDWAKRQGPDRIFNSKTN